MAVYRARRGIRPGRVWLLKILGFRYSYGRDAYVLRVIGGRFGPVYRVTRDPQRLDEEARSAH